MANAAEIIARIRARGANVVLADGKMRIINGIKLSADASHYIMRHKAEIIAFLQDQADEIEERAAIVEFDGGASRDGAMHFAKLIASTRDWPDRQARIAFLDTCGAIVDHAFGAAA